MKLTLEPTTDDRGFRTVSVSIPEDHVTVEAVIDLVVAALVAWGFTAKVVAEGLDEWLGERDGPA